MDLEREVPLMDVDSEALSVLATADGHVASPTSTGGRNVDLPSSRQSAVSPMLPPDGPPELPKAKRRRVTFADE